MSSELYPLTIYYDRSCPLCAQVMHALRRYDHDGRIELVDCSAANFRDEAANAAGISVADLMRQIHARDASGRWYRGVVVFVLAYRAAGVESVARMFVHPRLRPFWDRVYPWIARHRMALSALRLNRAFGWLVNLAARRGRRVRARCASRCLSTRDRGH